MESVKNACHRTLLRSYQGGKCCYCGVVMTARKNVKLNTAETVEHLRRKSDGGTHDIWNKALACRECNSGRGSIDWMTYKSIKSGDYYEIAA